MWCFLWVMKFNKNSVIRIEGMCAANLSGFKFSAAPLEVVYFWLHAKFLHLHVLVRSHLLEQLVRISLALFLRPSDSDEKLAKRWLPPFQAPLARCLEDDSLSLLILNFDALSCTITVCANFVFSVAESCSSSETKFVLVCVSASFYRVAPHRLLYLIEINYNSLW